MSQYYNIFITSNITGSYTTCLRSTVWVLLIFTDGATRFPKKKVVKRTCRCQESRPASR